MLHEIEESIKAGAELLQRTLDKQPLHIMSKAHGRLITLEEAGYTDMRAVQEIREELYQARKER